MINRIVLFITCLGISGFTLIFADEPYRGKYLGKLNSYHHETSAEVYAVDEYTLLLAGFNYDGLGSDTFFWAGASTRAGPQGFIVPNEYGKTDLLKKYFNKDIKLTLPDKKKLNEIRWFAVYDLTSQAAFGDVSISEDFEPPASQQIAHLVGKSNGVASGQITILDAKTILIPQFTYNGAGQDTYFWVGTGLHPASKGFKVPDEQGYLDPLRLYSEEDVILELPGHLTIFNIKWLSIYDVKSQQNFGSVLIPEDLNVPPSLARIEAPKKELTHCVQLHKRMQVSWEIFGPQITIQLSGFIDDDEYMAFGMSGSNDGPQMVGADVTVAFTDGVNGYAIDYNITARTPCKKGYNGNRGVCRDLLNSGNEDNQLHNAEKKDGITTITYRRFLMSSDPGDKEYKTQGVTQMIWAIGKVFHNDEPAMHTVFPRGPLALELNRKEPIKMCEPFVQSKPMKLESWEHYKIADKSLRTIVATMGPPGGRRGYEAITGQPPSGNVWYLDGKISPEVWLQRGLTYSIDVRGGADLRNPDYDPFIITDEPMGGYDILNDQAQKKVKVLAGVTFTLRGYPRSEKVGPLCLAKHKGADRRLDDAFPTFVKFNRSLSYSCEKGDPAILQITPNSSWPDTVYYNSFSRVNTGWKFHIVDNFNILQVTSKSAAAHKPQWLLTVTLLIFSYRCIFFITI